MTITAPLEGLAILVVEDEFLVATELARMIRNLGGKVVGPVSTLIAATELLNTSKLDGAVIDVKLGPESSTTLADDLLARGIPFVLTTGYATDMLPENLAHVPVLSKPYSKAGFREVVTKHFTRP